MEQRVLQKSREYYKRAESITKAIVGFILKDTQPCYLK
jgi:hypothetical protein